MTDHDAIRTTVFMPGATIGMVGGGQLGRMFTMAAAAMGYRVVVFCESVDTPAAQVAQHTVVGGLEDASAVERFASQCDVITLEFENIPATTIEMCGQFAPTFPSASVLATAQDRLLEKTTLRDAGLPVTPFVAVTDADLLEQAAESIGWPIIVKTARSGYDGKGQFRIESADGAGDVPWNSVDSWIAEQCIDFDRELSAIVARTPGGACECFPIFENRHRNHILDVTHVPANVSSDLKRRVATIAVETAETLDLVGLLCVEFFVAGNRLMINEIAPRPHNSGHLTIEACETSQFEQHVRAVCNLPLGSTKLRTPAAAMVNLLGDLWSENGSAPLPRWNHGLEDPGVHLHLYGKNQPKPGRKMGHLTVTGNDVDDVVRRVLEARNRVAASVVV